MHKVSFHTIIRRIKEISQKGDNEIYYKVAANFIGTLNLSAVLIVMSSCDSEDCLKIVSFSKSLQRSIEKCDNEKSIRCYEAINESTLLRFFAEFRDFKYISNTFPNLNAAIQERICRIASIHNVEHHCRKLLKYPAKAQTAYRKMIETCIEAGAIDRALSLLSEASAIVDQITKFLMQHKINAYKMRQKQTVSFGNRINVAHPTHYSILGVSLNAKKEDIRKAYRRLVLKFHPDKNPQDSKTAEVRMFQITEAMECLTDPIKRAEYDFRLGAVGRYPNNIYSKSQFKDEL